MEQLDLQGRKKGEFKVRLPDGRIQVTSYQAVNVDTFFLFTKSFVVSIRNISSNRMKRVSDLGFPTK